MGVWGHALGYGGRKTLWSNVSDTGTSGSGREPAMMSEPQGKEGGRVVWMVHEGPSVMSCSSELCVEDLHHSSMSSCSKGIPEAVTYFG